MILYSHTKKAFDSEKTIGGSIKYRAISNVFADFVYKIIVLYNTIILSIYVNAPYVCLCNPANYLINFKTIIFHIDRVLERILKKIIRNENV